MPYLTPEAERVLAPLIRRAARFGPYLWLALAAAWISISAIHAATGSFWLAASWALLVTLLLDPTDANREHVVERWLAEV